MLQHSAGKDLYAFQQVSANHLSFRVAVAGSGDRLLLCLHGFPESAVSWRHQVSPLAGAGYRIWAPDLRGYAGTTRPTDLDAYCIETLLDDVTALINESGSRHVTLVGHDWGGIIAWYYAMRKPTMIDALIVLNAPHPGCFEREIRRWRQFHRSWYAALFQIPWFPETVLTAGHARVIGAIFERMRIQPEHLPDDIVHLYRQQACAPGALTAMLNYYRAALLGGGAARQQKLGYPVIDIPTLVIWGLQDHALAQENLDGLERFVSNLTVVRIETSGHFVHQDDPQQVTQEILSWLQRLD
ncbi:MAG: alpha/beta hydrolase [Nitrospira sp.]|nr:alpha/beta hydrolase [Nitrospira sp.]